ncbi:MAG TPA: DUF6520 family protein [Gelidibacter sp.]|uniref:DUF6520 family protein n=1 Tax=Gelidibacter sp. TaxID=2018083 RepID=UPI002CD8E0AE|nr:DUF6520 family protein [Gelidibacter sp.]HTN68290.1 DUF6520 family protein [Dysgonamonadaceae bacterium]HXJ98942.1 DUF6520 family protein [Gelidibacter sp.]
MRKLKMILPMLAFILAIGVSFAYVKTSAEKDYYATKYIYVPGGWATIDVECPRKNNECTVVFSGDPQLEYRVYNSKNLEDPAEGDGGINLINGPVPEPD